MAASCAGASTIEVAPCPPALHVSAGSLLQPPPLPRRDEPCSLAAAAISSAAPLYVDLCPSTSGGAPFQLLPEELLDGILDQLLHADKDGLPNRRSKPLTQLYCTSQATRTAMLQWQRREEGAAGQARIGMADVKLAEDGKDGLGALEQLTRSFPRLATLRRLHLQREGTPESCLISFLSQPGAREKLATVMELTLEEEEQPRHLQGQGRAGQPLSSQAFSAIASACPSLAALKLDSPVQELSCLMPLHRLRSLRGLVVGANALPDYGSISPADLAALGSLTSLSKLSVRTSELSTLLPRLSILTLLSNLCLESGAEAIESPVPQFSFLASLQHLTYLRWANPDYAAEDEIPLPDATLSAICCCTRLVSLALPSHIVQPQQLLLMPRLKSLKVSRLDLSEPLPLDQGCSLESLQLLCTPYTDADLAALLPLCRAVKQLELPWLSKYHMFLGSADSPEEVSAAVQRVGAVARALAELASLCGKAAQGIELAGDGSLPSPPPAAIIAALLPLQGQLREITLYFWVLDQALVKQVVETLPGLEVLRLQHCAVRLDTWQSLPQLSQLSCLELRDQLPATASGRAATFKEATREDWDAFVGYAAALQRDLTVVVRNVCVYDIALWQQLVGERRRATGASGCVRIVAHS